VFKRNERYIREFPILTWLGCKDFNHSWTYAFRSLEDGSIEVCHHCHEINGPWPLKVMCWFHQWYVLATCESLINSDAFGKDDLEHDEEDLFDSRLATAPRPRELTQTTGLPDAPCMDPIAMARGEIVKSIDSLLPRIDVLVANHITGGAVTGIALDLLGEHFEIGLL